MRDQVEAALVQRAQLEDMADAQSLTFLASIAPLQSAITIASDGGARVKIDIPESEMPAIVRLMLCRGKVLRITVAVDLINENASTKGKQSQSAWASAKEPGADDTA